MAKHCHLQETCQHYSDGSKRRVHHIRIKNICRYWNGEYCTHKIAGVKEGDKCDLKKIRRIKND